MRFRTVSWTIVGVAYLAAAVALLAQHVLVPFLADSHMGLLRNGGDLDIYRHGGLLVRNGRAGNLKEVEIGLPTDPTQADKPEMPVPPNLDYDRWLKLLDRLIDTRLELSLGGLSRRHWQVLNVVRQGRTSQAEIDARVRPFIGSEGTAAREVADLQQRGWVTPGTAALELTEPGTNEFERLLTLVSDDRTTLMNGIAPEEYASTVSVLERMARNLGWTPPKAGSTLPTGGQS